MDIKKLDQEKFDTIKELTEISSNLSDAKVLLIKLKKDTEQYMVIREGEAEARVLKVLEESRKALEETSNNHNELTLFNNELKAYATELNGFSNEISTLFSDFNVRMKEAEKNSEEWYKRVSDVLRSAKAERAYIQADRELLRIERDATNKASILLMDRQRTLKDGFEELKKLKNKSN